MAVDNQHETVVGTDAHHVARGNGCQYKSTVEVGALQPPAAEPRVSDPRSVPLAVEWVRLARVLGRQVNAEEDEKYEADYFVHANGPSGFPMNRFK